MRDQTSGPKYLRRTNFLHVSLFYTCTIYLYSFCKIETEIKSEFVIVFRPREPGEILIAVKFFGSFCT